jgi:hypothetical protein
VSARDDLIAGLVEHACCFSEEDAKRMVDGFASEMAEQQRAWLNAYAEELGEMPKDQEDITEMIDLIDPAKSKGAT